MSAFQFRVPAILPLAACLIGFWFFAAPLAPAGTLHVPSQYQTIQLALFSALEGDEIIVAPGTHARFQLMNKNVVIRSTNPLDAYIRSVTIIDGQQSVAIQFPGSENETCVIEGFTITNSNTHGAIWGNGTHATLRHCNIINNISTGVAGGAAYKFHGRIEHNVITGNLADATGGALRDCDGLIQFNTISNNRGTGSYSSGGALSECDGLVQYNTITGNQAAYSGGAIYNCAATFRFNTIDGNSTTSSSSNGGAFDQCSGDILGNTITNNSCRVKGGGLYNCGGAIRGNVITGNTCGTNNTSIGGGLYGCNGVIANNIIAFNSAGSRGGGAADCSANFDNNTVYGNTCRLSLTSSYGGGLSNVTGAIYNCIIWGNTAKTLMQLDGGCSEPNFSCVQHGAAGVSNISDDPQFLNAPGGDFHLAGTSPCVDTGDPSESSNDACLNPTGLNTVLNDMGAYGGAYNCEWTTVYAPHISRYILGAAGMTADQLPGADLNANGKIDVGDVIINILNE